jgi:hypothetical protein
MEGEGGILLLWLPATHKMICPILGYPQAFGQAKNQKQAKPPTP